MSAKRIALAPLPGDVTFDRIVADVSAQIAGALPSHAAGYQGAVYISRHASRSGNFSFAVKVAAGSGFRGWLARWMLYREFRRYRRLHGCQGVPACYGVVDARFLILEFVEGAPLRQGEPRDREYFYARLFELIASLHARGIAHADLKRKDNLLVVNGSEPCLIDFGAAFVRREGFAAVNHLLFRIAVQFDLNAWIKLKYRNRLGEMTAEDRKYYRLTLVERIARWTRRPFRWLTRNSG
jgi:predicted Ser/Thr protein kinase